VPALLGEGTADWSVPCAVRERICTLEAFVAENAKTARAFLKVLDYPRPLAQTPISELNEHTPASALIGLLQPLLEGRDLGLLSEAGCPAIADPGAALVELAHAREVPVVPLVGPSSLVLALMGSGLNGQRFCFHGYLPVERIAREQAIRELEAESRRHRSAHLFIETPYRNDRLVSALLRACRDDTRICFATDLTLPGQGIATRTVAQWRRQVPTLDRRPTVFILQAG
jgi:16S rRNA (cytidine1402-2'-O)-methyltransferase